MTANLLIIGKKPPPIGGVTIHVERLCKQLESRGVAFRYLDPRAAGIGSLLNCLWWARICHIHLSNFYAVLLLVALSRLLGTKTVVTFHGDLFRSHGWRKFLPRMVGALCNMPLVLNSKSLNLAKKINDTSRQISSYIPPIGPEPLEPDILDMIEELRKTRKTIVATNAYHYSTDDLGREIYGVFDLITHAARHDYCLVLSDPSATYLPKILGRMDAIPENLTVISKPHSFYALLAHVDVFIRNTTTDGDSISVHEALDQGKTVYCTDVVDRPPGVVTYGTLAEVAPAVQSTQYKRPDVTLDLIEIYRSFDK